MGHRVMRKLTRFEVFKRDGFCCGYCGRTPPNVTLEVDHIVPKRDGGTDDLENLITSCFDCNRGKASRSLDFVPESVSQIAERVREREKQTKAYYCLLRSIENRKSREIDAVEAIFGKRFSKKCFTDSFRKSVSRFIEVLGPIEVEEAMRISIERIRDAEKSTQYFCGICWNKIKRHKR